ncbi:50S ribosomal protein L19 [bacterium DOLZORAL124_38_8]|nr:MAG: 50S ribosomal protein L19 [bacterium DOLZORAL124_38_8]
MSELVRQFGEKSCKASVPDLKVGMVVRVHQRIKEGAKERIQVFQGTVIKVGAGYGVDAMFTVRKISEKIGVEKCFPFHSPNVVKIEVLRAQKVRRSKLNFLRDRSGKALRLKEIPLKLASKEFAKPVSTEKSADEEK